MMISITDRNKLLNSDLRKLCERRLDYALSRFESSLKNIDLVIFDDNGPRGGIDKACRIYISLRGANEIIINEKAKNISSCISRIAERANRAVTRAMKRSQQFDRTRNIHLEEIEIT